ncbi:MAG TPA: PIN domain-containing protein [bacterium]|jgi:PIN domain nuclease of toxin-antitoxin system|nr:PIN domain-containing protein [Dictyoglomota bacterium]HHV81275.1 type II toxin-antitoxin system VapC family toxin [bacterium]HOL55725.1 PIN domain-containing protein [bacterium]HON72393.1 PIN domain-containing protein [bacterium]
MTLYIADTHALVWYFTKNEKLGQKAFQVFRDSILGEAIIIIPTIVLAETIDIAEKKRIKIDLEELLDRIEESSNFEVYPLDLNVLKTMRNIYNIPELHDKIIVSTARLLDAKLITKDENIQKCGLIEIVW